MCVMQLVQLHGCNRKSGGRKFIPRRVNRQVQRPNRYATEPHWYKYGCKIKRINLTSYAMVTNAIRLRSDGRSTAIRLLIKGR